MVDTLPNNQEAEESLLGAVLLSRDAVDYAIGHLEAADFYRPAHQLIFSAIETVYRNGSAIDPVTVADELDRLGVVDQIGGKHVLLTLQVNTPSTQNTAHYAEIIKRDANGRRQIRIATETINAIQDGTDPYDVADTTLTQMQSLDRAGALPKGFTTYDEILDDVDADAPVIIPGLCYADSRVIVVATEKSGKALALDTPVNTPLGWTTMGEIQDGDFVFSPNGKPVRVVAVTEPMLNRSCYLMTFNDGTQIVADGGHLWQTVTYQERDNGHKDRIGIRTTAEIAETVEARNGFTKNHQVKTCEPLEFTPMGDLPIQPYTFGAWLGDGTSSASNITCADDQIIKEIENDGYAVRLRHGITWHFGTPGLARRPGAHADTVQRRLRLMGVLGHKHIPVSYQRASVGDRLALLQGLMDTDGTISDERGMSRCEFSVVSERLARDFYELISGLGIKATFIEGEAKLYGRLIGPRYRIAFQTPLPVFRLARKADKQSPLLTSVSVRRSIVSVEKVPSVPVRCIQVENPDGMFVVGPTNIPTHNSYLARMIAFCASQGVHPFTYDPIPPVRVMVWDLENPMRELRKSGHQLRYRLQRIVSDYDPSRLMIMRRPAGIDIDSRHDRNELESAIERFKPQLIIGGPIYKMLPQSKMKDDRHAAATVQNVLDQIRIRHQCALILEHHAPIGQQGDRELRAIGGMMWQAWPDVSISLKSEDNFQKFVVTRPHPERGSFNWPESFTRGTKWPWEAYYPPGSEHEMF